jgi:hypothetical protein
MIICHFYLSYGIITIITYLLFTQNMALRGYFVTFDFWSLEIKEQKRKLLDIVGEKVRLKHYSLSRDRKKPHFLNFGAWTSLQGSYEVRYHLGD